MRCLGLPGFATWRVIANWCLANVVSVYSAVMPVCWSLDRRLVTNMCEV
jgi:hypothetical protein